MAKIISIQEWEQKRASREQEITDLTYQCVDLFDQMMQAHRKEDTDSVISLSEQISEISNKIKQLKENIQTFEKE